MNATSGDRQGGATSGDRGFGSMTRRGFVGAVGSAALAGMGGCWRPPREAILPYVRQPELVPGVPVGYATASMLDGYATGLIVSTREGRPIKVEGNPSHPASLGASSAFDQALLRDLYADDRLRGVSGPSGTTSWGAALAPFGGTADGSSAPGWALLMEPTSSPWRAELVERVRERSPAVRVYYHAAVGPTGAIEAYRRAGDGRALVPRWDFTRARVVVAFDADFTMVTPYHLRYVRDYVEGRVRGNGPRGRLYAAGPTPSGVSVLADHPLAIRSGDVAFLLGELVRRLGGDTAGMPPMPDRLRSDTVDAWLRAVERDLRDRRGAGAVVVGDGQPPAAHALAHEANRLVGAYGATVALQESALNDAGDIAGGLTRLTDDLASGAIDRVLVLEGDPVRTTPAGCGFDEALRRAEHSLCVAFRATHTARAAEWAAPAPHPFECWGDGRAFDGTLTPRQPLIRPLVEEARSPEAVLATLAADDRTEHEALRDHWRRRWAPTDDPTDDAWNGWWDERLREGVVHDTARAPVEPPRLDIGPLLRDVAPAPDGIEVSFGIDPCVHDGRFAPNPWLQELPDPVTKIAWSNAAVLAPTMARALGVEAGDSLLVEVDGRSIEAPAFPLEGHADGCVSLTLGRRDVAVGRHAAMGADAYAIRTEGAAFAAATVAATGGANWPLPVAQTERNRHGRPVAPRVAAGEAADTVGPDEAPRSWYGPLDVPVAEHQWGMAIDLSRCTGCSACVVACRAENNIPIVGPDDVRKGRLMDWLRVEAYEWTGPQGGVTHVRIPMMCQHCEAAPCEYVCPTYATVHSDDGLNEMVYNRCIGTRFCSNNCPYKVRRFNWFDYTARTAPVENLVLNPDVTVRGRGVMEKCTYCVQRIRRAEIRARTEGRALAAGEIVTACQQACPTRAIVFGDVSDANSEVSVLHASARSTAMLGDLGTRPRTRYLASVTDPSPALAVTAASPEGPPDAPEAALAGRREPGP